MHASEIRDITIFGAGPSGLLGAFSAAMRGARRTSPGSSPGHSSNMDRVFDTAAEGARA